MTHTYAPGAVVHARGRDWVVLPGTTTEFVRVRPLDGDSEYDALLFAEETRDSRFAAPELPPAPSATARTDGRPAPGSELIGDFASASLLRTALRISAANGAGPFRCLSGIAVQPRQYQLVPLMAALRMDTVRLLIGDDVGIGKTIEASLIAKELLEQGSARSMAVLCSPALAEQWQRELHDKFSLDAELVLPSTAGKLERSIVEADQTIFDRYPYTVVSTDFIKQRERRDAFLRTCPDLLIVDEAHTCIGAGQGHQQRHQLLKSLAVAPDRHLILVTATPHSGDRDAFAKLIGLLDPELAALDPAIPGHRDQLARHFVQRRRRDIRQFLDERTPFPADRMVREVPYHLDPAYAGFVADVLAYARGQVRQPDGELRRRMSWWSVLALLRCVLSSPAAGRATLTTRAAVGAARTPEEADRIGRDAVLESTDAEAAEGLDAVPGALLDPAGTGDAADAAGAPGSATGTGGPDAAAAPRRMDRRLKEFARRAEQLSGPDHDAKLRLLINEVKALLADGYDPIVFCRYIPTAHYVRTHLDAALGGRAHVEAVTGDLPPEAREARVAQLTVRPGRQVLVATDCLSEGVNLQERFSAVLHYDLSWNPTRHEQREGRVDRFGQRSERVRAVTLYETDTGIDGVVLDVLIRKHRDIAQQTGVALPVPQSGEGVLQALTNSLLLRGRPGGPGPGQLTLDFGADEQIGAARDALHREWESAAERESKVPTKFAHSGMRPQEVEDELTALRQVLGEPGDIAEFTRESLAALGAPVRDLPGAAGFTCQPSPLPAGLRHALGVYETEDQAAAAAGTGRTARRTTAKPATRTRKRTTAATGPRELVFHRDLPVPPDEHALVRTDPAVRAVARYVLDSALDPAVPDHERPARRLGVIRTRAVGTYTVLLLARYRLKLTLPPRARHLRPKELVAEDARVLAWRPDDDGALHWLGEEETAALLAARPDGNVMAELRHRTTRRALRELASEEVRDHLAAYGDRLAAQLAEAHLRVREAAGERGRARGAAAARRIDVIPAGPPDELGVYAFVPAGGDR
ncbi:helicase-related protein [Streptomyces aidingensis]|uniref:SNF2 family N-terminal domain-containing protein n=1 Tax=Streptomyces aidingensis TaxID=910347 RepID=A0A1I1SA03_9ACTN|nr:helicase-related protein [Streptomyces aidingensis]SFD43217.1 SNF2 family N-terminal domain-containing protein [Streptomyces aidingensis]